MYKMTSPIEYRDITIIKLDDNVDITDINAVEQVLNSELTKSIKRILVDFSGMVSFSYPAIERFSSILTEKVRIINCEPALFNRLYRDTSAEVQTRKITSQKMTFIHLN